MEKLGNFEKNNEIVEIDGSMMEGGGQILRISLGLSAIFGKSLRIFNIRGKREKSGLRPQHVATCKAVAEVTNSIIEGCKPDSSLLTYFPKLPLTFEKKITCDCNTAGSVGLMFQQLLPILVNSEEESCVELIGGTIVSKSPSVYYINQVLKPILEKMGITFDLTVHRDGLFPVGKGKVSCIIPPIKEIQPINLTKRGDLISITFNFHFTQNFKILNVSNVIKEIVKNSKNQVYKYIKQLKNIEEDFEVEDYVLVNFNEKPLREKFSSTLFALVTLEFENTIISVEELFSEKKEKMEKLENFANSFLEKFSAEFLFNENICVDEFTTDQLIIFMGLAKGKSSITTHELSLHSKTALELLKVYLPNIEIEIKENIENTENNQKLINLTIENKI